VNRLNGQKLKSADGHEEYFVTKYTPMLESLSIAGAIAEKNN